MGTRNIVLFVVLLALAGYSVYARWAKGGPTPEPDFAGLPEPVRPVHVRSHPSEESLVRFMEVAEAERARPTDACVATGLGVLGFDTSLRATRYGGDGKVHAAYVTGTDSIHVVVGEKLHIRHESVHALHDQLGSLHEKIAAAATLDERLALNLLSEGITRLFSSDGLIVEPVGATAVSLLGNLGRTSALGYARSMSGGDPLAAMSLSPRSVRELLTGDGDISDVISSVPPERVLCTERLGAAFVYEAFRTAGVERDSALQFSANWRGDLLEVYRGEAGPAVAWTVLFGDDSATKAWNRGPAVILPLTRAGIVMPQ